MTVETFKAQVELLRATWGKEKYPQTRIDEFWEALNLMPDHWFKACCKDFIGNFLRPPVLKDFQADAEDFKRREKQYALMRSQAPALPGEVNTKPPAHFAEAMQLIKGGRFAEATKVLEEKPKLSGRDLAAGKDE
jgi:hypothetical protein